MKRLLVLLAALLMAGPAFALEEWTNCGGTIAQGATPVLTEHQCLEFAYTSATSAAQVFEVDSNFALFKFDPNIGGTGTASATVMLQSCLIGHTQGVNVCGDMLDSALDGTEGAAATQKTEIRIPRGFYRVELTVAPGGGHTATFQVNAED